MLLRKLRDCLRARERARRRVSLVQPVDDDTLTMSKLVGPVLFILLVLLFCIWI